VTANDDAHSVDSRSNMTESDEGSAQEVVTPWMKKGRRSEMMQELVDRVRRFLGVSVQLVIACMWSAHICKWNPPRAHEETVAKLCTMFEDVASGKGKTRYTKSKTENGIKDTYMDVFITQILKHVKGIRAGTDGYSERAIATCVLSAAYTELANLWQPQMVKCVTLVTLCLRSCVQLIMGPFPPLDGSTKSFRFVTHQPSSAIKPIQYCSRHSKSLVPQPSINFRTYSHQAGGTASHGMSSPCYRYTSTTNYFVI